MSVIKVTVSDRELYFTDMPTVSAGATNVDSVQFTFDDDCWKDYIKTCIFFTNRSECYPDVLDIDGIVKIPKKILANEGVIHFGLCGFNENARFTTTILSYTVKNGVCYVGPHDELQKTNFEKILERCNEIFASQTTIINDMKNINGGNAYSGGYESTSIDTLIKWACLGDSITDVRFSRPKNYPYWINANNPSITIQNLGIAGSLICFDRDDLLPDGKPTNSIYTQAKDIDSDVDIISIFAGVNDYNWSVPLGTFTTDLTGYPTSKVIYDNGGGLVSDGGGVPNGGTFYQGCYRLAEYLRATFPYKPIIWFTPMTHGPGPGGKDVQNKYGNTIYQFMDAIKEVAAYFSIPCYDLGRQCSINPRILEMQNKYYIDNIHPNAEGSLILSRIIEREGKRVLSEWGVNV